MLRWPAAKSAALVTGACAVSSVCMPELSGHHDAVAAIDGRCWAREDWHVPIGWVNVQAVRLPGSAHRTPAGPALPAPARARAWQLVPGHWAVCRAGRPP